MPSTLSRAQIEAVILRAKSDWLLHQRAMELALREGSSSVADELSPLPKEQWSMDAFDFVASRLLEALAGGAGGQATG